MLKFLFLKICQVSYNWERFFKNSLKASEIMKYNFTFITLLIHCNISFTERFLSLITPLRCSWRMSRLKINEFLFIYCLLRLLTVNIEIIYGFAVHDKRFRSFYIVSYISYVNVQKFRIFFKFLKRKEKLYNFSWNKLFSLSNITKNKRIRFRPVLWGAVSNNIEPVSIYQGRSMANENVSSDFPAGNILRRSTFDSITFGWLSGGRLRGHKSRRNPTKQSWNDRLLCPPIFSDLRTPFSTYGSRETKKNLLKNVPPDERGQARVRIQFPSMLWAI